MNTYHITVIAEADTCPVTGRQLPELTEVVTVSAPTLADARRLVPAAMTMQVRGQMLRYFHNDTELFGNF